ncbi:unnamed protein product [Withania somnifera]
MGFIVGNGRKIKFWEDAWLGHTPLKEQFSGWNLFLRRNVNDCEAEQNQVTTWFFGLGKKIWLSKAPLKVSCFSWIVAKEACLTHSNLQKRKIQLCSRCPMCEEHFKDVGHLFLHCKVTTQLWSMFLPILRLMCKQSGKTWNTIPQAIWWTFWRNLNSLKQRCLILLAFWCNLVIVQEVDANLYTIGDLHNL